MTPIEILSEMYEIKRKYSNKRKNTNSIDEFTRLMSLENEELRELKRRTNNCKH